MVEDDTRAMVVDDMGMMTMDTEEVTDMIIDTDIIKKTALSQSGF